MHIKPHALGWAFGVFLGLFHAVWALLVWLGIAQTFLNFIFRLHMITPPYTISPFSFSNAVGLVIVTAVLGYLFGWSIAAVWNRYGARR